jgi:hypothetical protein
VPAEWTTADRRKADDLQSWHSLVSVFRSDYFKSKQQRKLTMRGIILAALCVAFSAGCAIERAQQAQNAKVQMIGMSKEMVLSCMGPSSQKSSEGATEIWTYPSGTG